MEEAPYFLNIVLRLVMEVLILLFLSFNGSSCKNNGNFMERFFSKLFFVSSQSLDFKDLFNLEVKPPSP